MMLKRMACNRWLACLWLCLALTAVRAQNKAAFRTIPQVMYEGDTIRVIYNPIAAGWGDSLPVKAFMYRYKGFQWTGYDFPMQKTDSGWVASYVVTDSTVMLAWRFRVGDSTDNGHRFPNLAMVHERKNRQMAPGAYTEYGMMRTKSINGTLLPLVRTEAVIEPKVLTLWVPKEWQNMYVRRGRFFDVAYGLSLAYGNKVDSVLRKGAAAIAALPDVTEKELLTIAAVYEKILHNKAAADSVKKQALAAYPQGLAYRLSAIWKLYTTRADTTLIRLWNEFNNRWPASRYPWTDYTDEVYGDAHIFSLVCTSMGNMYYKQHQWKEINKLLSDVPFPMLSYYYDHFVDYALRLDHPPVTMQEIMAVATSIVDTMQARVQSADRYRSGRGLYAPSEWKMLYMEQQSKIFAYHATLLNSQGQSKEALVYATLAQPYASRLGLYTVPFNNTYTTLLNRAGRTAEVLPVIRAAVYQGQYTQEMLEILKKDYIRSKGSDKGFADYVTSLKSKESIEKEQDEIRKAMVNLPATSFKLMNTKGEEVDLDKQKGKIVVIDFWATWCYYCKLAMPGMQMAVNKYQDDQNVAFYFIATMEENPSYKKMIDEFIKSKKYNFNVLYDGKNPATGKLDAAYAGFAATLKSSGIPLKVIIDQEGRIRWTSLGGSANHIAIANEVSYVIDLLKKEKG